MFSLFFFILWLVCCLSNFSWFAYEEWKATTNIFATMNKAEEQPHRKPSLYRLVEEKGVGSASGGHGGYWMHFFDWGVFQTRRCGRSRNDHILRIPLCLFAYEFFFLYFYYRCGCMLPGVWQCLASWSSRLVAISWLSWNVDTGSLSIAQS